MEGNYTNSRLAEMKAYEESRKSSAQTMAADLQGCASTGGCKVPLMEQFLKKRAHLFEELSRIDRLIAMLEKHPEFEAYQDFKDLQHRDW